MINIYLKFTFLQFAKYEKGIKIKNFSKRYK